MVEVSKGGVVIEELGSYVTNDCSWYEFGVVIEELAEEVAEVEEKLLVEEDSVLFSIKFSLKLFSTDETGTPDNDVVLELVATAESEEAKEVEEDDKFLFKHIVKIFGNSFCIKTFDKFQVNVPYTLNKSFKFFKLSILFNIKNNFSSWFLNEFSNIFNVSYVVPGFSGSKNNNITSALSAYQLITFGKSYPRFELLSEEVDVVVEEVEEFEAVSEVEVDEVFEDEEFVVVGAESIIPGVSTIIKSKSIDELLINFNFVWSTRRLPNCFNVLKPRSGSLTSISPLLIILLEDEVLSNVIGVEVVEEEGAEVDADESGEFFNIVDNEFFFINEFVEDMIVKQSSNGANEVSWISLLLNNWLINEDLPAEWLPKRRINGNNVVLLISNGGSGEVNVLEDEELVVLSEESFDKLETEEWGDWKGP